MNGQQVMNHQSLLLNSEVCTRTGLGLAYIVALERLPTPEESRESPAGADVPRGDASAIAAADEKPSGMDPK